MKTQDLQVPCSNRQFQTDIAELCRFRQFCILENRIGAAEGDTVRWFIADSPRNVDLGTRRIFDPMDLVKEGNINLFWNEATAYERAFSLKYNVGDIQMSQVDLMRIMREDMPVDAARTIEAYIEREMALTPYKYVPLSDAAGKEITLDDYASLVIDATTGKYNNANVTTGQLALIKRPYFGNRLENKPLTGTVDVGYIDVMPVMWAPDPLFFVYGVSSNTNPATGPIIAADGSAFTAGSFPAWFNADIAYVPRLNLTHLQNMIAFAIRQGMTGYRGLTQNYVLIAPPAQLINLMQDILKNQLKTTNASDLESASKYYGEQARIDLGVRVTLVADNYGTLLSDNRYNGIVSPLKDSNSSNLPVMGATPQTLFNTVIDPKQILGDASNLTDAVRKLTYTFPLWLRSKAAGGAMAWGGRTSITGSVSAQASSGSKSNLNPEPNANITDSKKLVKLTPTSRYPGLGPCYLFGEDPVVEVLREQEHVVENSLQGFKRLGVSPGRCAPGCDNEQRLKKMTHIFYMLYYRLQMIIG